MQEVLVQSMNEEMNSYEFRMFSQSEQKQLEYTERTLDLELGDVDHSSLLHVSVRGDPFSSSIKINPFTWI